MSKVISETIYKGRLIGQAAEQYVSDLTPFGIDAAYNESLSQKTNQLDFLALHYIESVNIQKDLTRKLTEQKREVKKWIKIFRNVARYQINDKKICDMFTVGKPIASTVASLTLQAEQILKSVRECEDNLNGFNFKLESVQQFEKSIEELKRIDSEQEKVKKDMKKFKEERDMVKDEVIHKFRYIQSTAMSVFLNRPDIKARFTKFVFNRSAKDEDIETNPVTDDSTKISTVDN